MNPRVCNSARCTRKHPPQAFNARVAVRGVRYEIGELRYRPKDGGFEVRLFSTLFIDGVPVS